MQLRSGTLLASLALLTGGTAFAADQTVPGAGNPTAAATAASSPRVAQAEQFLIDQAERIHDRAIRAATLDLLANPHVCIRHRIGLGTTAAKDAVVAKLLAAGLISADDGASFPGGLRAGVFPPALADGTACPQLPMPFRAAPGSSFGGHHSYPGGLPIHEANNDRASVALADQYRQSYGDTDGHARFAIDEDVILAAPLWHDWTKPLVFQWNADGTEFAELNFGGNGKTDNFGQPGDSRTGGHHILAVAEAIARSMPPALVIAQASAHSNPTNGSEFKVVNWLRAAAIIAGVDAVAAGYLAPDATGTLRLPPLRKLGSVDLNAAGQTNLLAEYTIHNLSDADFTFSIPAVTEVSVLLASVAARFGFDPADAARYNNKFRNVALSHLSAERLLIVYATGGLDAVSDEIEPLRRRGVL
ncbi:MAG TPA: hypothetical protein VHW23_33850 [Kofleriaceae bacterium]|jgi:hypothetical protein|nr:hypothetical protein [Kofleriaceae bacterium]